MEIFDISNNKGIRTVRINNPRKKNALNFRAYYAIAEILNKAAEDDSVKALVFTGTGDFFR